MTMAGEGQLPRVAVIIPCYNEGLTIAAVVARAKAALPGATVCGYDHN